MAILRPTLLAAILVLVAALLMSSLIVTSDQTIFPFIVGKALYSRVVIELIVGAYVLLQLVDHRFKARGHPVIGLYGLYALALCVAGLLGSSWTRSFWSNYERMDGIIGLAHWMVLLVVVAAVFRTYRLRVWAVGCSLGLAGLLAVVGILQAHGWPIPGAPAIVSAFDGRATGTFGNAAYLASVLSVNMVLAAGLALFWRGDVRLRALLSALAVLLLVGTFETGTRASLGAIGVAMVGLVVVLGRHRRYGAALGLLLLVGWAVVGWLFAFGSINTSNTLDARADAWEAGARAWAQRPVLGYGPENFTVAFNQQASFDYYAGGTANFDRAHNAVIEQFVAGGAIGGFLYMAFWGALLYAATRARHPWRYPLTAALGAYFVQNLFLFDTTPILPTMIILAGIVVAAQPYRRRRSRQSPRHALIPFLVAPAAAAGMIAVLMMANAWIWAGASLSLDAGRQRDFGGAIAKIEQSYEAAPTFVVLGNELWLTRIANNWPRLTPDEREAAVAMADRYFPKAIEAEPENPLLLYAGTLFYQVAGEVEKTEPMSRRLIALAPTRPQSYYRLAAQAYLEKDYDAALSTIDFYTTRVPESAAYFRRLGVAADRGRIP